MPWLALKADNPQQPLTRSGLATRPKYWYTTLEFQDLSSPLCVVASGSSSHAWLCSLFWSLYSGREAPCSAALFLLSFLFSTISRASYAQRQKAGIRLTEAIGLAPVCCALPAILNWFTADIGSSQHPTISVRGFPNYHRSRLPSTQCVLRINQRQPP